MKRWGKWICNISQSMQSSFIKFGIWLEGNVEIMHIILFLLSHIHVDAMATQIVKIQSPKLDSAISQ